MHKPDLDRILSGYPDIKLVQPSRFGAPTEEEAMAQERSEGAYAIATFNLIGVQSRTGVVDYEYVHRLVQRLERAIGLTAETRLFQTRLGVLTGEITAEQAARQYQHIRDVVEPEAAFTWTGVQNRSRLDSFFDPFGSLTVKQRAILENAREMYKMGRAEEADALREELAAALSAQTSAQLHAYWQEHVREAR